MFQGTRADMIEERVRNTKRWLRVLMYGLAGGLLCVFLCVLLPTWADARPYRRYALLVGVSKYSSVRSLKWSHRDVERVYRRLRKLGFASSRIRVLVNEQATKAAMIREMQRLQRVAKSGDVVVFFYSGHGTVVPDPTASDGCQMALAPHDTAMMKVIKDDETQEVYPKRESLIDKDWLASWLRSFRTNKVLVVLDSCFSGDLAKGARGSLHVRFLPSNVTCRLLKPSKQRDSVVELVKRLPFLVWTASHARQLSYEHPKFESGVFTRLWLLALDRLFVRKKGRFVDWVREMKREMKKNLPNYDLFRKYIPAKQQSRVLGNLSRPIFLWKKREKPQFVKLALYEPRTGQVKTAYRKDQIMQIGVRLKRDAWIAVCTRSTSGEHGQLYPSDRQTSYKLRAGREHRFPPSIAQYTIAAEGRPGAVLFWVETDTVKQPTCGKPPVPSATRSDGGRGRFVLRPGVRPQLGHNGAVRMSAWVWAEVTR